MPTMLRNSYSDGQVQRAPPPFAEHDWVAELGLDGVAAYATAKNKKGGVSRGPRLGTWQAEETADGASEGSQQGELTNEVTFRSAIPRAPVVSGVNGKRAQLPGRRSNSTVPGSDALLDAKPRAAEHFRNLSVGADGTGTLAGGRETCRYFLRTGTCGYGDKCRYEHPKTAQKPELNSLGYPLRQGECACRFFIKNGWCGFGPTCKFHHPELPPRKPQSQSAMAVPGLYPPSAYRLPPSPHLGSVHHQPVYQTLMPPPPPGAPAAHMPQGMYPYMVVGGMPPMLPPVAPAWTMTPPDVPVARHFLGSRRHSARRQAGRDSFSDESTTSMVSSGYGDESDLHPEDYRYGNVMSPTSARN